MKKTQLEDLILTIEQIRQKKFSEIPANIVEKIILIEEENIDERGEAHKAIRKLMNNYLSEETDNVAT